MSCACRPSNLASRPRIAIVFSVARQCAAMLLLGVVGLGFALCWLNTSARAEASGEGDSASGNSTASAISAAPTITSLKLGFNGHYKVGFWTPLTIGITTGPEAFGGQLIVETVDGDGLLYELRKDVGYLADRATTDVKLLIKPGRPRSEIRVTLRGFGERVVASRTFSGDEIPTAILATQELMLEVGQQLGMARLKAYGDQNSLEKTVVALCQPEDLPLDFQGLEGVDYIAIATSNESINHHWKQGRTSILLNWVSAGGRLLLCVGRNGDSVLNRELALDWCSPGKFNRVVDRGPGAWEQFATALADPMRGEFSAKPAPIPTTVLENVRGKVELKDGEIPVVIRTNHGLGQIIFIAADLDQAPFKDWPAMGRLWLRILNRDEANAGDRSERESISQSMRLGYTDLSGQLRSALDQFEGVRLVPFWMIALLGGAYVLLLFPLEYWLAGRMRRYVEIAWITFPLLLIASGALIYQIAQVRKGHELRVNSIELVDVDLVGGVDLSGAVTRGNTWLSCYSPITDRYRVKIDVADDCRLAWLGMPGTGLGGMNSNIITPQQFTEPYQFDEIGNGLAGVPLASWSSKAFHAAWADFGQQRKAGASTTTALVERARDRTPTGTVVNRTGKKLHDCVLLYGGWSYKLGTLEVDQSMQVEQHRGSVTINSYLTQRRMVGDKEQATPYDPAAADMARIVEMIGFHEASGGRQYTGLSNRYYATLDMSDQLAMGRAVLVARGAPVSRIEINAKSSPNDVTFSSTDVTVLIDDKTPNAICLYRFVLPVDKSARTDESPRPIELKVLSEYRGDSELR